MAEISLPGYDYEDCDTDSCNKMMKVLEEKVTKDSFIGTVLGESNKTYKVQLGDNYQYTDPVDCSIANNQGIRVLFEDGSRLVYRLSGTGSSGATVRLYIESYEDDPKSYNTDPQVVLKPLVNIALSLAKLPEYTGRSKPTVIT